MESIAAKSTLLNDQSMASMSSVNRFILTEDDLIEREGESVHVVAQRVDNGVMWCLGPSVPDVPTPCPDLGSAAYADADTSIDTYAPVSENCP